MSLANLDNYRVLHWLAHLLNPKSYLEVGIREGASVSCVLAKEHEITGFVAKCLEDGRTFVTPSIVKRIHECFTARDSNMQIHLFDNWSYKGGEGGHSRIVQLLKKGFNHTNYHIYDGDSKETLPKFFNETPRKRFPGDYVCGDKIDLVYVDGDHTREGAWNDLNAVCGHFKTLVFHDLYHPQHSYLSRVFKQYVVSHDYPHFIVGHKRSGIGVAFDLSQ